MRRSSMPLGLALVMLAGSAWAQDEPSAADMGAARALGQEGVKLADAGNCQDAVDRLSRAEKMYHAPTTLGRLGECQVQIGKLVEGTENLNRVVRENLSPNAPQAFKDAQERAKKVFDAAKPRVAKLKIAVAAPPDAKLVVKLDNENVPVANLNTNRPTDPGEHTVEVSAPGFKTASAKVKLAEGGVDSVALTLEVDPNAAPPVVATVPPAGATTSPVKGAPPASESRSRAPAYVAFGAGVVGLGVGTIFGILALSKKNDLDSACANKICPNSDQQDTIDNGKTFGTVSTIGFGVAIAGAAVGTILLLWPSKSDTTKASLKPSWRGLSGTF